MFVNRSVVNEIGQLRLANSLLQPSTKTFDLLVKMDNEPFEFYLTGSRFFGSAQKKSDWDVFTHDIPEVRSWLTNEGFSELDPRKSCPYVNSPNSKQELAEVVYCHDVQIQLIKDPELKNKLQNALSDSELLKEYLHSKSFAKLIWEAAFVGATTCHKFS